ncbi:hypothetical protein ANME2D_02879 [Candidatus Methanoperedens nitroreducens]|uniref:Sirohydrochlorin cobaltochelatase n=1 Tax=Candidatus Methanoperedens nitratireducens TaxID=1392998 RepID=A0A062V4X2_9EURY|nr:hypothetical protein [Candidatus Methanoperedens nitroreducens]KCZ70854.1 hypothetical protein ANME2D_02879 [Candidatus Methanoperedens nitroreducens]MDJ1420709.1 hypothetical protein [Candidatus Methanoperedens sp.]
MVNVKKPTLLRVTALIVVSTLFVVALQLPYFASAQHMKGDMEEEEIIREARKAEIISSDITDMSSSVRKVENTRKTIPEPQIINQSVTGVLVYTHAVPNDPLGFEPGNDKITAIENDLEKLQIRSEKILHMPYTWNFGLMSLGKSGVKYSIFLYTDMFGPNSTVIHNVTRIFAGIDDVDTCPGLLINESNAGRFNYTRIVQKYGPICSYMGAITIPAPTFSDSTIVLAEPARPDHPILREIFVKQVKSVSQDPKNEIIVLVGHGARNDFNDEAQKKELSNAASYVKSKMGFAGSTGVTAREDWPDLYKIAVPEAVSTIKSLLNDTGAKKVILVPATGGHGFDMIAEALDSEGINYVSAPETLPIGEKEFRDWALKTVRETIDFIKKERPTESTITPYWNRTY